LGDHVNYRDLPYYCEIVHTRASAYGGARRETGVG
jgi:hypothetical protein